MAEESSAQEKTEDATPRKLEKAKEEGQVPRSRELTSMALVIGGGFALVSFLPAMAHRLTAATTQIFRSAARPQEQMLDALEIGVNAMIWSVLPLMAVTFVAAIVSSLASGGLVMSAKAIAFKGNRMSPLSGFKRMFSAKSLMELVKSLAKFVLIAGAAVVSLSAFMGEFMNVAHLAAESAMGAGLRYVGYSLLVIASTLILVAVIDLPFQISQHAKQLRMTKQEVKDEMKDSEGKPEVRSRIRQLQQEIAQRKMLSDVPEADVILTNPEHYSVAIKYDRDAMAAPIVVAKGVDHLAFKIREIAELHDVPVVRQPRLTRALYHSSDLGEEVPVALYAVLAQVLAYIFQLAEYRQGLAPQPVQLGEIRVPPEFDVE